ncbi:hypothetical protein KY284_020444 [Solanum tuberosum]|nr:hypothetical protein KY284_020444 [Solanum tuberosum]
MIEECTGFPRGSWNEELLRNVFPENVVKHILNNIERFQELEERDNPMWMLNNSGKFIVKSTWDFIRTPGVEDDTFARIWEKGVPLKMVTESSQHLFVSCPTANQMWSSFARAVDVEGYKPIVVPNVIYWKPPMERTYKCNSDGASKGNPGQSASGFCIRNWKGELIFAATYDLGIKTGLEAETSATEKGLNYGVTHNLLPVCLKTDSLVLTKILHGSSEVPWSIKVLIKKIEFLRNKREVEVYKDLNFPIN